jgi:predicted metal-dependent hydrolase
MDNLDVILTQDEMAILEENVNFISYKRSISCNYNSVSREMSISKPENLSIDKCETFLRNRINYLIRQDLWMLEKGKFDMQGYQGP